MSANFVILRRCYFDLTNDHCAAKLIEYFNHWTRWKIKHHRTNWIYMPLRQIYADLMGEHSQNVIRNAIQLLIDNGWLQRRHNPGNGQDRTWQYCLNFENIQKALKQRSVNSEVPIVKNDRTLPVDPPRRSDPQQTTPPAAVEFLDEEEEEEFSIPDDVVQKIESDYQHDIAEVCTVSPTEDVELLEALKELDGLLDEVDPEDQYSAPILQNNDNVKQEVTASIPPITKTSPTETEKPAKTVKSTKENGAKLDLIDRAGLQLNVTLERLVTSFTLEEVQKAIAHFVEVRRNKRLENPEGWFTECLKGKYWLTAQKAQELPRGFTQDLLDWYNRAIASGKLPNEPANNLPYQNGYVCVRQWVDGLPFPKFISLFDKRAELGELL